MPSRIKAGVPRGAHQQKELAHPVPNPVAIEQSVETAALCRIRRRETVIEQEAASRMMPGFRGDHAEGSGPRRWEERISRRNVSEPQAQRRQSPSCAKRSINSANGSMSRAVRSGPASNDSKSDIGYQRRRELFCVVVTAAVRHARLRRLPSAVVSAEEHLARLPSVVGVSLGKVGRKLDRLRQANGVNG